VSTGWPAVREKCQALGIEFDPWQEGAGRLMLAKREDGSYAATVGGVVLSIPRQVGKTFLVVALIFALCLLTPGLMVLWTSHHVATTNETFRKATGFCRRRKVAPFMLPSHIDTMTVNFKNGSRIMFGARERGFGRGFDDVDVEVFDEAQILSERALDDMIPAMNTAANPLPIFMGTPPKPSDPSEVFTRKRHEALHGEDHDTAFIEFSADRGCDPLSHAQWRKANPSYPHRTNEQAMLRMRKQLTADSFMREGLGVWDDEFGLGEIPRWIELADPDSKAVANHAWSLAVSPLEFGPQFSCFGLAGRRADGRLHVEALDHRPGTWWVCDRAAEIYKTKRIPLRVRTTGAEGALIAALTEAGVKVDQVSAVDAAQACGAFIAAAGFDDAGMPLLHHLDDPDLNKAVRNGRRKPSSNGSSSWDELRSPTEITPLMAVTVALGGVPSETRAPRIYSLAAKAR